jgi:uncharacterized protein (DUF58 family)
LTKEGVRLAFVGVIACIVGLVAGWDAPLVFGGAILALVVLAILFTSRSGRAEVLHQPKAIECERLSTTSINIATKLSRRFGVYAEVMSENEPRRLHRFEQSAQSSTLTIPIDTRHRFAGNIGPIRLVCRDPFGIASRVIVTMPVVDVVVTPRIIEVSSPRLRKTTDEGTREISSPTASSTITATLREYVVGDEPRRIHWRSSARMGQLMVRRETSSPASEVFIVLDRSTTTWNTAPSFKNDNAEDNFELAIEAVAALIDDLLPSGRTITLLCSDEGATVVDHTAERAFLRTLATVEISSTPTLTSNTFVRAVRSLRGTTLIVVTRGDESRKTVLGASPKATIIEPPIPEAPE